MNFSELVGQTISEVQGLAVGSDRVVFVTSAGRHLVMTHYQCCCENVSVEDICGDVTDIIGSPITLAEEVVSCENPDGVKKEYQDSFTWTFYKLATAKGYVTIRWYGESNGYYSEDVSFFEESRDA